MDRMQIQDIAFFHKSPAAARQFILVSAMTLCALPLQTNAAERCDVHRSEYPMPYTLPDGKATTLYWYASECDINDRGYWIKVEKDGKTCGMGYQCKPRIRGGP